MYNQLVYGKEPVINSIPCVNTRIHANRSSNRLLSLLHELFFSALHIAGMKNRKSKLDNDIESEV